MKFCAIVSLLVAFTWADNSLDLRNTAACFDLKYQESLDLEAIAGKWFVVEILEHRADPKKATIGGRLVLKKCPTVYIKITRHDLKLTWIESAGDLEYSFWVPDFQRRAGFWKSKSLQNGTLANQKYSQFFGAVHVMKAVASHMVLTFCAAAPETHLYSVLLSRTHNLQKTDTKGVHNLLTRRSLPIVGIKETCTNGVSQNQSSLAWLAISGLLAATFWTRLSF